MAPDGSNIEELPHSDMMNFESPVWSPDGLQIAFTSRNVRPVLDSIYVMDAEGINLRKLADVTPDDGTIFWSPDGTQLAFSAVAEGLQVFVVDTDGNNLRQLTYGRAYYHRVEDWSPDGTRLVISNLYEMTHYHLSIIDLESSQITDLTSPKNGAYDYFVGWMPDGESIFSTQIV